MKIEGASPVTSEGISRIFGILAIACLFMVLIQDSITFIWAAMALFVLSSGWGVEIEDSTLTLKYTIGKTRIQLDEIKEVMLASELKGVALFKCIWKEVSFSLVLLFMLFTATSWTELPIAFLAWIFTFLIAFLLLVSVPIYVLRENFGKIFLASLGGAIGVSILIGESLGLGILLALTFLVFMVFYVMVDYVIIFTEKETFVISCLDGRKIIKAFEGVKNEA